MGCLYKIEFANGKSYIGISVGTAAQRLKTHEKDMRAGSKLAVHNAMRKHSGKYSVRTLVIAGWDYLCELERLAILAYKTKFPHGYNLTDGGDGRLGSVVSLATRERLSRAGQGRTHSEESKMRISIASKGNQKWLGKQHAEETKQKQRLAALTTWSDPEIAAKRCAAMRGKKHKAAT